MLVLSDAEEAVLVARARSVRSQYRDRLRAQIVLAAAAGQSNAAIARAAGVCPDTVRKWRRRFAAGRLQGLKDAPRSGRPPVFTAADRAEVVALARALPAESGVPLSRWSCPELARELAARCQIAASASTIRRWLAGDALKPWQHRSWIIQRKIVSPNDFTDLDQIRDRLAAFETRYNAVARPFNWKFTRTDLDDLLRRIDAHDKTPPHALAA